MASPNTLQYGNRSPQVEMLQLALFRAGYNAGQIDGIFGQKTKNAVITFQRANGLVPDGIVGTRTWNALTPALTGYRTHTVRRGDTFYSVAAQYGTTIKRISTANPRIDPLNLQIGTRLTVPLGFDVVPTDIRLTSVLLDYLVEGLIARYPFITSSVVGRSVMGRPLYALEIGVGEKHVFFNGAHHANEWITGLLLLRYLEKYAQSYIQGGSIGGESAETLFRESTLFMIPVVNPDGVDLVNGNTTGGKYYTEAVNIAKKYPKIPFPAGWKANIAGTDLNLQYSAGWENARSIKFAQGYTSPAPRDYVGVSPLSAPESAAVYEYTRRNNFALTLSYHTQGEVIYPRYLDYSPPCTDSIGAVLSERSGYTLETTPSASGYAGYKDWFIYEYYRPSYTVEAGRGVNPLPIAQFDEIYRKNEGLMTSAQLLRGCER